MMVSFIGNIRAELMQCGLKTHTRTMTNQMLVVQLPWLLPFFSWPLLLWPQSFILLMNDKNPL